MTLRIIPVCLSTIALRGINELSSIKQIKITIMVITTTPMLMAMAIPITVIN
jgi:hypothetical protein